MSSFNLKRDVLFKRAIQEDRAVVSVNGIFHILHIGKEGEEIPMCREYKTFDYQRMKDIYANSSLLCSICMPAYQRLCSSVTE